MYTALVLEGRNVASPFLQARICRRAYARTHTAGIKDRWTCGSERVPQEQQLHGFSMPIKQESYDGVLFGSEVNPLAKAKSMAMGDVASFLRYSNYKKG
jgi:hypothetical protein